MFAAASAARQATVLVVPSDADVERLTSDARFFLAALEGLSDADVERVALPFPSHEVDPYRGLAPHFEIASARARALHALAGGHARLVIASAASLLPLVSAPNRLRSTSIRIDARSGDRAAAISVICWSRPAIRGRIRSTNRESSASGAASSTSTLPARHSRSGSSSSATSSNRSAPTIRRRSDRRGTLDRIDVLPLQELVEDAPESSDRSASFFDYLDAIRPVPCSSRSPTKCVRRV